MDLRTFISRIVGALALAMTLSLCLSLTLGGATASAAPKRGGKAIVNKAFKTGPIVRQPTRVTPLPPTGQRPLRHLILIPGGGFTFHDANFWPTMAPIAISAGFVPHLLDYRLFDLGGAVSDAYEFAENLKRRYGRNNVFAYGSSAGGTLAALLASEGLVSASVASSALYDFRDWPWATYYRGPDYLEAIRADWGARRAYSPVGRRLRCPLLAVHGSWDPVVPVLQAQNYVATHPRARLRLFGGGHGLYRTRPASINGAMRWLKRTGKKQAKIARKQLRGARAAEAARRIRCI